MGRECLCRPERFAIVNDGYSLVKIAQRTEPLSDLIFLLPCQKRVFALVRSEHFSNDVSKIMLY